jgi:hypothetical protein
MPSKTIRNVFILASIIFALVFFALHSAGGVDRLSTFERSAMFTEIALTIFVPAVITGFMDRKGAWGMWRVGGTYLVLLVVFVFILVRSRMPN